MMKVLLLDDHPLFAEALATALNRECPTAQITIGSSVSNIENVVIESGPFDVALIDFQLSGGTRGEGVRKVLSLHNSPPVLVISGAATNSDITEMLNLGAKGYVPKSEGGKVVAAAATLVAAGGTHLPSAFVRTEAVNNDQLVGFDNLNFTPRELDVIECLKKGSSNKEIARALSLELPTVKQYIHRVFSKLGVKSRSQALIKILN